jgi:endonuclease/exonuclease/phosphatase family metal-dependent hydrolase
MPRVCNWAVFADKEADRARFAVYNTHFDHVGSQARLESARLVVSRVAAHAHMRRVVMGDLNVSERRDAVSVFLEAGFRDSFRVLHPDEEAHTFHNFRGKGIKRHGKIDYIFCDDRWKVLGASVARDGRHGRFPSDHFPVTAELAFVYHGRR